MDYGASRQIFGNKMRHLRQEQGITQEQLAELIGKTTEHVSFLERGERSPSFEVILEIAESLNVSVSYLMNIDQPDDYSETLNTLIAAPVTPSLVEPVEEPITTKDERSWGFLSVPSKRGNSKNKVWHYYLQILVSKAFPPNVSQKLYELRHT